MVGRNIPYGVKFFVLIAFSVISIFAAAAPFARAATCQVPLRNVLVAQRDCAYYETAFRMMATGHVSVSSYCVKGSYVGPNGLKYDAQVLTTLTVHDTDCRKMKPLDLNPVLLSKPNCPNLMNAINMLSTSYVGIDPVCTYGSWIGSDSSPRTSMVSTRVSLRSRVAQR